MRLRSWHVAVSLAMVAAACSLNPQPLPPGDSLGQTDAGNGATPGPIDTTPAEDGGSFGNGGGTSDAGSTVAAAQDADVDAQPAASSSDAGDAAATDGSNDGSTDAPSDGG